jgi:hypothetical protein
MVFMLYTGGRVRFMSIGLLAGAGIITKGYREIREAEELEYVYNKKFNEQANN